MSNTIPGKVVTGLVRFSYVSVFQPKAVLDSNPKYSVTLLIPKDDKDGLAGIKKAIDEAKEVGKSQWGGKIPKNLKEPLRDGDEEDKGEGFEGHYFVNAYSSEQYPPTIVDRDREAILDAQELYSGCYGRASIKFYPYAKPSKGVACGLNALQKIKDGDRLDGGASAKDFDDDFVDDFDDIL